MLEPDDSPAPRPKAPQEPAEALYNLYLLKEERRWEARCARVTEVAALVYAQLGKMPLDVPRDRKFWEWVRGACGCADLPRTVSALPEVTYHFGEGRVTVCWGEPTARPYGGVQRSWLVDQAIDSPEHFLNHVAAACAEYTANLRRLGYVRG